MVLALLLACTAPDADSGSAVVDTCGDPADSWVGVATYMYFAHQDDDGHSVGFDLDGVVSDGTGPHDCGKADLTSPDGRPGIDNAMSGMLPALEATEASAVEGLIQDSILTGELLLLVELSRLDDPSDDSCVDGALYRGDGAPMVGTDGQLLDDQTFAVSSDQAPALMPGVKVVDGTVDMGPFEFQLPIQILDVALDFHIQDAWMHLELAEDETFSGWFGGVIPLDDILLITEEEDLGSTADLIEQLVTLAADIDATEEGACDGLSVVFEISGTRAFLYE